MTLERLLRRLQGDLSQVDVRYALVGGLAVGARTEPRFTSDIDMAVSVKDDAEAERLVREFIARGYSVLAVVEQTGVGRLATARLRLSGFEPIVDLLFASSGIEPEIIAEASEIEVFPDLVAPVAEIGHLIAMKVLSRDDSRRDQDKGDLRRLITKASKDDVQIARSLLGIIQARGYHRGKDLLGELDETMKFLDPESL